MLTETRLREKIQYRSLLVAAKAPGAFNLDLRVQRYKAVSQGQVLGYYSSLALACATVDGVMITVPKVDLIWTESEWGWSRDYVLDVQRHIYYTRELKDPHPESLPVTEAAA